jgi:hypothetical protein
LDLIVNTIKITVEKDEEDEYIRAVALKTGIEPGNFSIKKILSKALDLHTEEQFYYRMSFLISTDENFPDRDKFSLYTEADTVCKKKITTEIQQRPIIVGFGPAGMFAALELIAHGQKPLIFERGKRIEERSVDVEHFITERKLNPESNIQFGEGGAGSYSDGKLFSRRNKNTSTVNRVLKTFVQFGAPAEIEYISKPHLGTDILCEIVRNIRLYILQQGGEIYYNAKMTDLLITEGKANGIVINEEREILSSTIFIALGHSARNTMKMMSARGVAMEQKKISVGVRIEHPARVINRMRYGRKYESYPGLGAATYSLNYTNRKTRRGVYTFCMCPGGEVVNASSGDGRLVVNGMSYSARKQPFSNGALVVSCHTSDYKTDSPLAGFTFQEDIEKKVFHAGGADWSVPSQNLMDFLGEKGTSDLREHSFKMGAVPADMKELFPGFVVDELLLAFRKWKEEVPMFVSHHAVLLGAETRTTSPVRICRNEQFESVTMGNIFPIGEGAGYTGGITSSAADAIKAVAGQFA